MTRRTARAWAGQGTPSDDLALAWKVASEVADPEIPALTIADLGVLRDVRIVDGVVEATITPTHTGCPAMHLIALNVEAAIENVGFSLPRIKTVMSPAWRPDWITEAGRTKLRALGIVPPAGIAESGSTAQRVIWRCNSCGEPFDFFKNT